MTDLPADQLMSVDDAIRLIDGVDLILKSESIALAAADGRVLAWGVTADRDYPPFDRSLMDGFAVRAEDASPGARLINIGEVAAGVVATESVARGQCAAIMTGAPLPQGANAVVPIERVSIDNDRISINSAVRIGDAIAPRAAEASKGQTILSPGTRLGPAQLAACAQVGATQLVAAVRPRVGILSSGNEVVPFDQSPAGAQIRNANSVLLTSIVRRSGAEPIHLGHVPDEPQQITAAIQRAADCDVLLVTGGMSMGKYDYTPGVMRQLGYDLAITKLRIRPGKPFVMGVTDQPGLPRFVFGLPGNPVSAFVCTVRLVLRLLARMQGLNPEPTWTTAILNSDLQPNGPREFYQPVSVTNNGIDPLSLHNSADLFTLARANALLRRPAGEAALVRGCGVSVLSIAFP